MKITYEFDMNDENVGFVSHSEVDPYLYLELKHPQKSDLKFRGILINPILLKNANMFAFLDPQFSGITMFTALDIDSCEKVHVMFVNNGDDGFEVYVLDMEDIFTSESVDCVEILSKRFIFNKINRRDHIRDDD